MGLDAVLLPTHVDVATAGEDEQGHGREDEKAEQKFDHDALSFGVRSTPAIEPN